MKPENFEDELRRQLRPMDAPDGFTERLMRALPVDAKPILVSANFASARAPSRPLKIKGQFGMPAALAASLLVAVLLGQHVALERQLQAEQQGREASIKLMQALRVTSQKLDIAYQAVQSPPPASPEENRS